MSRTIVVTGGGVGIGRAVAAAFAADGDRVVITGRREDVLKDTAEKLGDNVVPVVCDATDPDQVASLREQLPDVVDVLVNNVGGTANLHPDLSGDLHAVAAHWKTNLDSNLMTAVLTTTMIEPLLPRGGTVIHIGSFATDRGQGSYGAAKAALASWNLHLARRLGARGITTNVVSPGYIADTEFFGAHLTPEFHQARTAETLVGRAGVPDDIAGVVHFLATPGARHITAQVVHVNGGALTTR